MSQLFWLIAGHFIADYPLQSDFIAKAKNRHNPMGYIPAGQTPQVHWPFVLTAHAATHAGAVTLATGSVGLGCAEFVVHWLIDFAKCEKWTSIYTDQGLHISCKIAWWLLLRNI